MASNKNYDYSFKFTLLGMYGAGKTSIIDRYTENIFNEETPIINGIDYKIKKINFDNKLIKLYLWEPERCCRRYERIPFGYEISGAHGLIFIYDLTDIESFKNIQNIINRYKQIDKKMINQVCKILVGNKCDKPGKCVSEQDVKNLCDKNNMTFFLLHQNRMNNRSIYQSKIASLIRDNDILLTRVS